MSEYQAAWVLDESEEEGEDDEDDGEDDAMGDGDDHGAPRGVRLADDDDLPGGDVDIPDDDDDRGGGWVWGMGGRRV